MKEGRSLTDLFAELDRQASTKKDFIASTNALALEVVEADTPEAQRSDVALRVNNVGAVLRNLITGGDISQFGLVQAVTATANTLPSYDRATDFEAFGGQVLVLPQTDWKEIANARPAEAKQALAA